MMRLTPLHACSCLKTTIFYLARSQRSSVVLREIRKLHGCTRATAIDDRQKDSLSSLGEVRHLFLSQNVLASSAHFKLSPLFVSKRNFSAETYSRYFSQDVAPIGYAQTVLEAFHSSTGLPWWASIALLTVMLRGAVTLPLAVYSMHVMAKVELLQPEIMKLSQELRKEVARAVKQYAWDEKYARFKYNSTMNKLIKDLYIRDNCHPAKSSLVLWFQIPMWVCLSFALRNMSGAVPTATPDAEAQVLCPDLKTEGTLWFPDLTAPDSTWILPVLLGVTNLLNIEMHTLMAQKAKRYQKIFVNVMRLFSLIMVPIGAAVPSCMCYYWLCSSMFGLGQNVLFKIPSVRRLIRLPKTASESQTPFADMYNAAKLKFTLGGKQKQS